MERKFQFNFEGVPTALSYGIITPHGSVDAIESELGEDRFAIIVPLVQEEPPEQEILAYLEQGVLYWPLQDGKKLAHLGEPGNPVEQEVIDRLLSEDGLLVLFSEVPASSVKHWTVFRAKPELTQDNLLTELVAQYQSVAGKVIKHQKQLPQDIKVDLAALLERVKKLAAAAKPGPGSVDQDNDVVSLSQRASRVLYMLALLENMYLKQIEGGEHE